jgi:hypothetical protein
MIIWGSIFLIALLNMESPLEIKDLTVDRWVMLLFYALSAGLIFFLFRAALKINKERLRYSFCIVLTLISFLYFWDGFGSLYIAHSNGPVWEDIKIYTNQSGDKVISEFMEVCGSMYSFRERLIFHEFSNGNRISIAWSKDKMHGLWKVTDIKKDSVYFENFDSKSKE